MAIEAIWLKQRDNSDYDEMDVMGTTITKLKQDNFKVIGEKGTDDDELGY